MLCVRRLYTDIKDGVREWISIIDNRSIKHPVFQYKLCIGFTNVLQGRFHWTMNGVGLEFNHLFGFGVLDAGAMTALAANWRSVPPRYHCEAGSVNTHT